MATLEVSEFLFCPGGVLCAIYWNKKGWRRWNRSSGSHVYKWNKPWSASNFHLYQKLRVWKYCLAAKQFQS